MSLEEGVSEYLKLNSDVIAHEICTYYDVPFVASGKQVAAVKFTNKEDGCRYELSIGLRKLKK